MAMDGEQARKAHFAHIFARLQELPNYVWDPEIEPFHSVRARHQTIVYKRANAT